VVDATTAVPLVSTRSDRSAELVSVVIPVHNREKTIQRAVESALSQTHDRIEVIVVDDGSTDSTIDVLRGMGDERIRLLRNSTASGGPAVPRNVALDVAVGSWIGFLDSDDFWLPHKVAGQLAVATDTTALVYSRAIRREGETDSDYHSFYFAGRPLPTGLCTEELIEWNFVPTSTVLVRAEWVGRIGRFARELEGIEDYHYWLRLAMAGGAFGFLDDRTTVYSWHRSNLSLQVDQLQMRKALLTHLAASHPEHRRGLRRQAWRIHRWEMRKHLGLAWQELGGASRETLEALKWMRLGK
jgi:glycosyltransferase involved in cell wall biosynthesis